MVKYTSIDELTKASHIDFFDKKPSDIIGRLPIMKKKAEQNKRNGEYENAYILYKRWQNCIEWLSKRKQLQKDKKFVSSFLINNDSEINKVNAVLKEITQILDTKYAALKKSSTSQLTTSIEKMQIDSSTVMNDSTLSSVLMLPEIPSEEPISDDLEEITCIQLYNLLRTNIDRLLIIDTRPVKDFEDSRIDSSKCINVPPEEIKKGKTANTIRKYLQKRDENMFNLFRNRGKEKVDTTVILNLNARQESLKHVENIYEILRYWDPGCKHGKIASLKGGFVEWLNTYPTYVTNINIKLPDIQKNHTSDNLSDIIYPDLRRINEEVNEKPKTIQNKRTLTSETNKSNMNLTKGILRNSLSEEKVHINTSKFPIALTENKHIRIYGSEHGDTNISKDFGEKQVKVVLKPIVDRSCKPTPNEKPESSLLLPIKRKLLEIAKHQLKVEREIYDLENKLFTDLSCTDAERLKVQENLKEQKQIQRQVIEEKTKYKGKLEQVARNFDYSLPQLPKSELDKLDLDIGFAEQQLKDTSISLNKLYKHMEEKSLSIAKQKEEDIHKEPLKSDGFSNSSLKRSHSSPNLAQVKKLKVTQMDERKTPQVDRSSKPQISQQSRYNIDSRNTKYLATSWSDREQRMEPVYRSSQCYPGITGLKNLGNSCYMNSIIQCLSNTATLAKYFNDNRYVEDLNARNKNDTQGQVAEEVAQVIKALWRGQFKSITPRDLKIVIGQYKLQFESYEQQDSHEFLTFLLDWMHNDLKKEVHLRNEVHLSNAEKEWIKAMGNQTSVISSLFFGQLRSTICCSACENNSTTYEIFNSLSMSLSYTSKCTLDDCIKKYVSGQKVSGWKCPHCKVPREATKKFDFVKLSPIIVIHLNRFGESGGWIEKKNTAVDFPLTDFNLEQYVARDAEYISSYKQFNYNLYAMSNHYGTMDGGHYTAFCKSATQDKWYKYDDQTVTEVSKNTIKSQTCSAYLLFYSSLSDRILPTHRIDT